MTQSEADRTAQSRRRFMIVYAKPSLWSMGTGAGALAFSVTPRAMAAQGHEVHIVLPSPPGEPPGEMEREGIRYHQFRASRDFVPRLGPVPLRLINRLLTYRAYQIEGTRAVLEVARKIKPELIVAYGTFEAPVARRVARQIGVPNVTRLFGNSLCLTLHDPIRFHLNFPEVRAFRTPCDRLILTNDGADGEAVAKKCGVPSERFVHLRNGLDFDLFSPGPRDPEVIARLGLSMETPILVAATRLAMEKRLERIIEAMPGLLRRIPEAKAVLIGEGPERGSLEARVRQLGISSSVYFPGSVPNRALPAWYRSADLVLSLLDRTNAANPVFEAMACGRCVVALNVGTTWQVVQQNETGILIDKSELQGLSTTIADLLEDEDRRHRIGKAARAHARRLLPDPETRMSHEIGILLDVIEEADRG